eukprot:5158533-Pleurochrysis_carterae.AAC.2
MGSQAEKVKGSQAAWRARRSARSRTHKIEHGLVDARDVVADEAEERAFMLGQALRRNNPRVTHTACETLTHSENRFRPWWNRARGLRRHGQFHQGRVERGEKALRATLSLGLARSQPR